MKAAEVDSYLELPKEESYNRFQDNKNIKTFKGYLIAAAVLFFIGTLTSIFDDELNFFSVPVVLDLSFLVFLVFIRINYNRYFSISNTRKYLFMFFMLMLGVLLVVDFTTMLYNSDPAPKVTKPLVQQDSTKQEDVVVAFNTDDSNFESSVFIICISLLFFRFSKSDIVQLYLAAMIVPVMGDLLMGKNILADYIPVLSVSGFLFLMAYLTENRRRQKFNSEYDFHYKKNYESMRMKRELDSARAIQLSMLPPQNAVINGLHIAAVSKPATEVGGDYFDYFPLENNKIGVFICDVSGHGVSSALVLSGLRSCIHLILEETSDPKVVLQKLNTMIRRTQNRKMFVTAVFAVFDLDKNICELYNAGHLPPYKISEAEAEIFKIKQHGIALGAINDIFHINDHKVVINFNPGDKLALFTDGLNESMNSGNEDFGFTRIEKILNSSANKSSEQIVNELIDGVSTFTGGSSLRDDITILIAEREK